jgi:hypothetical protein
MSSKLISVKAPYYMYEKKQKKAFDFHTIF